MSAGVLWKSCASITKDNFDFSGVCISATSALESELKRVFYTGFQNFLEARYGKPDTNNWKYTFANWPEKLLSCTQYDFKKSLYSIPEVIRSGNLLLKKGARLQWVSSHLFLESQKNSEIQTKKDCCIHVLWSTYQQS